MKGAPIFHITFREPLKRGGGGLLKKVRRTARSWNLRKGVSKRVMFIKPNCAELLDGNKGYLTKKKSGQTGRGQSGKVRETGKNRLLKKTLRKRGSCTCCYTILR